MYPFSPTQRTNRRSAGLDLPRWRTTAAAKEGCNLLHRTAAIYLNSIRENSSVTRPVLATQ